MLENLLIGVLDVSLQMSLLLLLLFLADKFLSKRVFPQSKCWIWAICSVRLLIPITFPFAMPQSAVEKVPEMAIPAVAAGTSGGTAARAVFGATAATEPSLLFQPPVEHLYEHITVLEVLAMVWIAAALLFLLGSLAMYLFHVWYLTKNGNPVVNEEVLSRWEKIKAEMCVTRPIQLQVCENTESPMLIGLFHTYLVLPHLDFTAEQLSMVFRHELAHCRRRDLPVKWLLLLVRSIHWFNPLVHSMARKASFDLESACDDTVLRGKDKPYRKQYGNVLLHVMSKQKKGFVLSTHFSGNTKEIWKRFQNIVSLEPKRKGIALICCMIVGMAAATSSLNPATAQTLSPGMISLLKSTVTTPKELADKKELLTQCLEGSIFETYKPYQDLDLRKGEYNTYEQMETFYKKQMKLCSKYYSQISEYLEHPSFFLVNEKGPVTNGLFCFQTNNDMKKGQERFRLIWLDFSDPSDLQVMDFGSISPYRENALKNAMELELKKQEEAYEIANKFEIDLSQYRKAYSIMDLSVLENQAVDLGWSIQKQLQTLGRYQFEWLEKMKLTAYIRKDHLEGIVLNRAGSGDYVHYFKMPKGRVTALEEEYPIFKSRSS